METRTRSLTEGGILAAVMVVLAVVAVYVPLLGILAVLLWPLPAAILIVRHGLRWGVMSVIVAALLTAVLIEPTIGLCLAVAFGPVGLALGTGYRRGHSATRIVTTTMVVSIAAKFAGLGIVFSLTGMEPFSGQLNAMEESFGQASAIYQSLGMSEAQITAARDTFMQNIAMVRLLLPLVVVTMGLLDTMANFWALGRLLSRLGQPVPPLPPFKEWRLPAAFLYIFGFSLLGMYWGSTRELTILYQVSLNLNMGTTLAGLIEGVSLYEFVTRRYGWPRLVTTLALFFIVFSSFLMPILVFTGLLDTVFDYRKRYWRESK